jgi:hypothetical protein
LACHVARQLNIPSILVVGPNQSQENTWKKTARLAGLRLIFVGHTKLSGSFKKRVNKTGLEDEFNVDYTEPLYDADNENVLTEEEIIEERGITCLGYLERVDTITIKTVVQPVRIYYKPLDERGHAVKDIISVTHRVTTTYIPQDLLKNTMSGRAMGVVGNRILLVLDEAHFAKNDSITSKAAIAMTSAVQGTQSKVLLLSGTLMDKEIQATTFCRLLLLYTHPKLYFVGPDGKVKLTSSKMVKDPIAGEEREVETKYGLQQLLDVADRFGSGDQARAMVQIVLDPSFEPGSELEEDEEAPRKKATGSGGKVKKLVWELWRDVFSPKLRTAMLPVDLREHQDFASQYLFIADDELRHEFGQNLAKLDMAVAMWHLTKKGGIADIMAKITPAMKAIEVIKATLLVEKVMQVLEADASSKVVVFLTYQDAFKVLENGLRAYLNVNRTDPIIQLAHGEMSLPDRDLSYNRFNQNNLKTRVLIASILTSSSAISLHDTHGSFPRTSFIIPTWSAINITQAARRTLRMGLKTRAVVRVIYGNAEGIMPKRQLIEGEQPQAFAPRHENRLISCIARKSVTIDANRNVETQEVFPLPSEWFDDVELCDGTVQRLAPVQDELEF